MIIKTWVSIFGTVHITWRNKKHICILYVILKKLNLEII
jgi:hypothetical protein